MYVEYRSLSAPQLAALDRRTTFLLLPVSSTEQHGPHLPVGTDAIIGRTILEDLAAFEAPENATLLCLPPLTYGRSAEHMSFPGTVTLRPATFLSVLEDLLSSVAAHGVRYVIFLNTHGGNTGMLTGLPQVWKRQFGLKIFDLEAPQPWSDYNTVPGLTHIQPELEIHAGEKETSILLSRCPELVEMDKARNVPVRLPPWYTCWSSDDFSPLGIWGNAADAKPETGALLREYYAKTLHETLLEIINCAADIGNETADLELEGLQ